MWKYKIYFICSHKTTNIPRNRIKACGYFNFSNNFKNKLNGGHFSALSICKIYTPRDLHIYSYNIYRIFICQQFTFQCRYVYKL